MGWEVASEANVEESAEERVVTMEEAAVEAERRVTEAA